MKKKKVPINIIVDEDIKNDANKVLEELGLSMSGAITIYLKQIIRKKGIPFSIKTK